MGAVDQFVAEALLSTERCGAALPWGHVGLSAALLTEFARMGVDVGYKGAAHGQPAAPAAVPSPQAPARPTAGVAAMPVAANDAAFGPRQAPLRRR